MQEKFIIIESTFPNLELAKKLAKILLEKKLAPCVQIKKIESFYIWQEKITNDEEFLISIKTRFEKFDEISEIIKENHSYNLPEIIALPILKGDEKYLSWIETNLSQKLK
jgi:periplasmic divalent cation tolerance protein